MCLKNVETLCTKALSRWLLLILILSFKTPRLKNVRYDVKWVSDEYIMIFRDLILSSKADYSSAIFFWIFLSDLIRYLLQNIPQRSSSDYSAQIFLRLFLRDLLWTIPQGSSLDYSSEIFFRLFLRDLLYTIPQIGYLDYSSEIFFRPFLRDLLQTIPQRGTLVRTPIKWWMHQVFCTHDNGILWIQACIPMNVEGTLYYYATHLNW